MADGSHDRSVEVQDRVLACVRELVDGTDFDTLDGPDAAALAVTFAELERIVAVGKVLAAERADVCRAWAAGGFRSGAEWLARLSGSSQGQARASLEAAKRTREQPAVRDAWRAGALSAQQADQVSTALDAAPADEEKLLAVARHESLGALRQACARSKAAARQAETDDARYRRHRANRKLRLWTDRDGAGRIEGLMPADDLAQLASALAPFHEEQFDLARSQDRREKPDAYLADALIALAAAAATSPDRPHMPTASPADPAGDTPAAGDDPAAAPGPEETEPQVGHLPGVAPPPPGRKTAGARERAPAQIIVHISHTALTRGWAEGDEFCEIEGIGAVPVSTIRAMTADAILAAVVTDGTNIRSVVHLGRQTTARQRTALKARDRTCVVPGCPVTRGLEIDHVAEWSTTNITTIDQLARLCHHHHSLKTHDHWTLHGPPGHWTFTPPPTTRTHTGDREDGHQPLPDLQHHPAA